MNDELILIYVHDQQRRNYRPRSIDRRRDILRSLVRFTGKRLLDLTKEDIDKWLDAVPRVARTRYNLISTVSCFFDWAMLGGLTGENPARRILRPRLNRGVPRPISHADLTVAVHTAQPMIRSWLLLAALGGLRCQEIAGISREHIWDHEDPGVLLIAEAKGGGQRTVPLHPEVLTALRVHGLPRTGPLFRNRYGRPYSPERVSQLGNAHLHGIGIQATMHQLRHRFGTDVYALSKDLRVTQELMGHQSPTTTAIYTRINPAHAVAVVNQLAVRPLAIAV